jgi:hypothetical protein
MNRSRSTRLTVWIGGRALWQAAKVIDAQTISHRA